MVSEWMEFELGELFLQVSLHRHSAAVIPSWRCLVSSCIKFLSLKQQRKTQVGLTQAIMFTYATLMRMPMNSALFSSGSTSGKSAWFSSRTSCCSSRTEGNTHGNQTLVTGATLGNSPNPIQQNIFQSDSPNTLKETQRALMKSLCFLNSHTCTYPVLAPTPKRPQPPDACLWTLATLAAKLRVAASNDALISIRWSLPIPHQSALRELMFMAS